MAGTKISELPAATLPLTGAETVPVVQSGATKQTTLATMPYVPSGTGAVTTTVQAKLRETVSVKDFGAVGNGVTNDTAAIQAAIDSGYPVFVPAGRYYLATPLQVEHGNVILGENGRGAGYSFETRGSYFLPATCAIQTKSYTTQYSNFTLNNIGFIGGTVVIDLGLFHEVDITDCSFFNPSIGAIVLVRGEKNRFERVRIDSNASGYAPFGMSVGRWQDSLYNGYSDAFFVGDGVWIDRTTFKEVHFQAGQSGGGTFSYGIRATTISASVFINCLMHALKASTEISVINTGSFRASQIINFQVDTWGNASSPPAAMFEFGEVTSSQFIEVSPQWAGNNHYVKGISCNGGIFGGTFINCRADGNNTTQYGFYFREWVGQHAVLMNCRGAYFHNNGLPLIRNQITQISCNFSSNNGANSSSVIQNNQSKFDLMMADTNGSATCSAAWGAGFAQGGGGISYPFYVKWDRAVLNGQSILYLAAAPTTGTWGRGDIVYNTAPASAGYVGWVCTAAGTPGTWKTFGLIS